jgi:hypothetical protein
MVDVKPTNWRTHVNGEKFFMALLPECHVQSYLKECKGILLVTVCERDMTVEFSHDSARGVVMVWRPLHCVPTDTQVARVRGSDGTRRAGTAGYV